MNAGPAFDWHHWARRLLVCNPFFLCSAALLLFGVNRLSLDPDFLNEDRANLLFNYSALQLYGFLVVGTALILARKRIWYDSALLVVVENGLVVVPFLLLSQGTLLNSRLGMALALGACGFAAVRALAIRRWYPQFNLPRRALALGAALLIVNTALPLLFPSAVVKDTEDWATPNSWLWYLVLPVLVAGANLLPKPGRYGGLNPERHWLPLFIYALWVTGTGTHFWCLEHISNLRFELHQLGPAAVVAAWTLYRRIGDCVPEPSLNCRRALLCCAFATPLVSIRNPELFEALVLANAIGFTTLFMRDSDVRTVARELLVLCLPLAAVGLPQDVGRLLMPYFARHQGILLGLSLLVCLGAMRRFRAPFGLAGAIAMTVLAAFVRPNLPLHAYVEVAALFLLTHSLAWPKGATGATFLRVVAGMVWFADAAIWVHDYPWRTDVSVTAAALILLGAWVAIWRVAHERPDLTIVIAATAVSFCAPTDWLLRQGSPGLVALVSSAFLFAIGFTVAWTRHCWETKRTN